MTVKSAQCIQSKGRTNCDNYGASKTNKFTQTNLVFTLLCLGYLLNFPYTHCAVHYGIQCEKCGYIIQSSGRTVYNVFTSYTKYSMHCVNREKCALCVFYCLQSAQRALKILCSQYGQRTSTSVHRMYRVQYTQYVETTVHTSYTEYSIHSIY